MAIKKKENGRWKVDTKTVGRKRFRATFNTRSEAVEAERKYLGGETPTIHLKKAEKTTLRNLYDMCLKSQHCDWFESTKTAKCRQSEQAQLILNYFGEDRDASTVADIDVVNMVDHFAKAGRGNSKSTLNKKLSALSMMYKIGKRHELVTSMPDCSHIKIKKAERNQRIRVLKREDEPKFLEDVWRWCGHEWMNYFTALIDTGCRTGELGYASKHHIDWSTGSFDIYPEGQRKVKAGARTIRMTDRVMKVFEEQINLNGPEESRLFPFFIQNTLNKTIWPRIREAQDCFDHDFIPHMMRHTCATRLVELGANIEAVRKWMGHESLQTTLRYIHMSANGLDEAVALLNQGIVTTRHATRHDMPQVETPAFDPTKNNDLSTF